MKKVDRPNLPNSLTIFRIVALPFCAYALFKNGGDDENWRVIAFALFFIVGLSDILDGKMVVAGHPSTKTWKKFIDDILLKEVI